MATITLSLVTTPRQDAALERLLARANDANRINAPYAAIEPLLVDFLIEQIIEPAERDYSQDQKNVFVEALDKATDKQREDVAAVLGMVSVPSIGVIEG